MAAFLTLRGTGKRAWQVWPVHEAIEPGAIQETGEYVFELRDCPGAAHAELLIDDISAEPLRTLEPDSAVWRWSPGFHAGIAEVELRLPDASPHRFDVITDPDLRKLTRADFDAMVREILEDTFALFSLTGLRTSVARGIGRRAPAIARIEFLRSRILQLEIVVGEIAKRPRNALTASEKVVPSCRAVRATGLEVLRSFQSGRIRSMDSGTPFLPAAFKGFMPDRLRLRARAATWDLPEHRQIAGSLRAWASWLATTAALLHDEEIDWEGPGARKIWAGRCRQLAHRLTRLAEIPLFAEAGVTTARLMPSAVFRHDRRYRDFFRLAQDMNLGIANIFGDFLRLPLARTFELYELWCFLRLLRAGAEEFGPGSIALESLFQSDGAGGITIAAAAVNVPLGQGWTFSFRKRYGEFWLQADRVGSFSRQMAPDIVLLREPRDDDPGCLLVMDAKYRIESNLNEALSSIHAYQDGLVRQVAGGGVQRIVTAAYLLAPAAPKLGTSYRETSLPGRLFHPEYRRSFRFGALTLRPGMKPEQIAAALKNAVEDATQRTTA